ncbi:MAG: hypothetical protein QM667_07690 [Asticcacaulis sp.]
MKTLLTLSVVMATGLTLASAGVAGARDRGFGGAGDLRPAIAPAVMHEVRQMAGNRLRSDLRTEARSDEEAGRVLIQQRYSIDEAITLVERRSGGRYISGSQTGPSTFVIKVQNGPNIETYRVDLSNKSVSKV